MRGLTILLGGALLLAACSSTPSRTDPQVLVDRSALTVTDLLGGDNDRLDAASMLRRARGAVVCPQTFRIGFIGAGEGGACVLVGRDGAGSWSSPAFYGQGGASVGFQAGIQDSQTLLLIMNDRALTAMLNNQFRLGADASVAVAHIGGAVEGATTTNLGADIIAFSRNRGLFAGVSIEGNVLNPLPAWNSAYYGREVTPRDIVVNMTVHNPGADPLRAALMRFGQGASPAAAAPAPAAAPITPASAPARAAPRGSVSRAPLPPPPPPR
jgi:lipid-binding SYLF domain-containing protein